MLDAQSARARTRLSAAELSNKPDLTLKLHLVDAKGRRSTETRSQRMMAELVARIDVPVASCRRASSSLGHIDDVRILGNRQAATAVFATDKALRVASFDPRTSLLGLASTTPIVTAGRSFRLLEPRGETPRVLATDLWERGSSSCAVAEGSADRPRRRPQPRRRRSPSQSAMTRCSRRTTRAARRLTAEPLCLSYTQSSTSEGPNQRQSSRRVFSLCSLARFHRSKLGSSSAPTVRAPTRMSLIHH